MKLWITRDNDGALTAFEESPKCSNNGVWYPENVFTYCGMLPSNWFPEVTFENSPKQIEIKLID